MICWVKFLVVFALVSNVNLIFSDVKTDETKPKSKIQKKFDRLWQSVEKKKARNDKLKQDMDGLVSEYNQTVLPKEKEYIEPLCALLNKLTIFYSRKSLAQWQRDELSEWFSEVICQLSQYSPEKAQHHAEKFQSVFCQHHEISEQALKDSEDLYQEELDADSADQNQDDMFDTDGEFNQAENPDFNFNPFNEEALDQPAPKREAQLINGKWIRKLFRRTAQALHPDKEQNPEKREHKQNLMSELLRARDNKDVMTMMMLYNQHVDGGELALVEDEMHSLCQMLEQQQRQLDVTRTDIIYQSPLHASIHENLYAASPKTRNKKLKEYLENVQDDIDYQFEVVEYLGNLSQLKKVLEKRANQFNPMAW